MRRTQFIGAELPSAPGVKVCGAWGFPGFEFADATAGYREVPRRGSIIYTFASVNGRAARHIWWVGNGDRMNKPWMKQWKDEAVSERTRTHISLRSFLYNFLALPV